VSRPIFIYKLIPARPTFPADITEAEMGIMRQHAAYWTGLLEQGHAIVFGQVREPAGSWGLAVVEADSSEQVESFGIDDPAVINSLGVAEVHPMPVATARPHQATPRRPA
jgi:uncharacterized protein